MNPRRIIEKKRDGLELNAEEIKYIIDEYVAQRLPDYQMAALLMAIYLQGMSFDETSWLTTAMIESGERIDLSFIPGPKVDKHSTGGVGDKVSLILAPLVAAAGVSVPMISGRQLAHSGGTLDKLEAIPGFNTRLSVAEFKQNLAEIGVSLIGQTDNIVPADKKIYALRDAISTVKSVPLVTASIMSKKIAEGINALVLDVKVGRGAFFKTHAEAKNLAQHLITIGERNGVKTVALLTAMDEPLGNSIGNWLETREAIDCLKNRGPADLMEVAYALGAMMLILADKAVSVEDGIQQLRKILASGQALEKFIRIVEAQGGDVNLIHHPEQYPESAYSEAVASQTDGFIQEINALEIGLLSMALGAGRNKKEDGIDYTAGILLKKKHGDEVRKGDELATLFSNDQKILSGKADDCLRCFRIAPTKPPALKLIYSMIDADEERRWEKSA